MAWFIDVKAQKRTQPLQNLVIHAVGKCEYLSTEDLLFLSDMNIEHTGYNEDEYKEFYNRAWQLDARLALIFREDVLECRDETARQDLSETIMETLDQVSQFLKNRSNDLKKGHIHPDPFSSYISAEMYLNAYMEKNAFPDIYKPENSAEYMNALGIITDFWARILKGYKTEDVIKAYANGTQDTQRLIKRFDKANNNKNLFSDKQLTIFKQTLTNMMLEIGKTSTFVERHPESILVMAAEEAGINLKNVDWPSHT